MAGTAVTARNWSLPDQPASEDLIEGILGIHPDSPLGALRRRRPEALRHAEGAFRELLLPKDPGALSRAERAALALRVARQAGDAALAVRYRALLQAADAAMVAEVEAPGTPSGETRLGALLLFADQVALAPEGTSQADMDRLAALGLSSREIVAATQLIAFVPYQVRLLAGLRAMLQERPQ
jgi:uncharacterized protein YciW